MFDTSIANPAQLAQWGKMVAAYVVVQSNGKAVIQDFSLPVFPILLDFDIAFTAAIKVWCPACKVTQNPAAGLGHRHDHPAGRGLRGHQEPGHQLADLRPR